jgi:hypothetical protein
VDYDNEQKKLVVIPVRAERFCPHPRNLSGDSLGRGIDSMQGRLR